MPHLVIRFQGDGAFQDLLEQHGPPIEIPAEDAIYVAGLDGGMVSGKPSVAFGFVLPDGRWVFAQTSLALFLTTADALRARFGEPRA